MTDSFRPNKYVPHPPKHLAAKDPILYRWLLDLYNYTWQVWFPKQRSIGAGLVYDDENRVSVDALIAPSGQPVVAGGSDESSEQGPPGPPGLNGSQGAVGPPGPPGEDGQDGSPGAQGATGATGATGAKGDDGAAGATGATGATGPAGADGAKGAAGADGATGATGATGPPGIGIDGDSGDIGPPGPVGPMGPQGPMGPPGQDGEQGEPGDPGPMGGTYIQIPLYYETNTALAGTPSGAFEAGIGQSTAFGMRYLVPTGYKLLIVHVSAGWDTGAGAGTWSIDIIARVSGANTTLMTITTSSASSSGNKADLRSMANPFATYNAASLVAVGFSNRSTSPGPMGTAFKRAYVGCILVPAI